MKPRFSAVQISTTCAQTIGLILLLGCSASNQPQPSKNEISPTGRAQETWAFWESFNKAATSGVGAEVLKDPVWQGDVDVSDTCAVLQDIVAGEQARNHAITSLPVLHVDPDLAAYATEYTRARMDLAATLEGYIALAKRQQEITSGPALGLGLLINLLNHSNDKEDGILWRAMLDEARDTASDLEKLREPARTIEGKAISVRDALMRLRTDEMAMRVKLSQRFNREFPPRDTYASQAGSTPGKPQRLTVDQIKRSLIGHSTPGVFGAWTFEALSEFVSMSITSVKSPTSVEAIYEVETHVKGIRSGNERNLKLRLRYGWLYTRWIIVELQHLP